MVDLRSIAKRMLDGCVNYAYNGTKMYTPDGMGCYHALWTRDFSYMLEYAGDLIPEKEAVACIDLLISGARGDGWIPDRVYADGSSVFTAGMFSMDAEPNLDNGPFLVIAASCLPQHFPRWQKALERALDCLPADDESFIYNDPAHPHSPYGFTDCIRKTGRLCMETLLYWRALRLMLQMGADRPDYAARIDSIEAHFQGVFENEDGLFNAATGLCNQPDLWASCYAVSIGFPMSDAQKRCISKWFIDHADEVIEKGQLRHLPAGMFWEGLLLPTPQGEYQNGAFWATPVPWLIDTLKVVSQDAAEKVLRDVSECFENEGVFECINGDYKKLDLYVASATNVYGAQKRLMA